MVIAELGELIAGDHVVLEEALDQFALRLALLAPCLTLGPELLTLGLEGLLDGVSLALVEGAICHEGSEDLVERGLAGTDLLVGL